MFTGLVAAMGTVRELTPTADGVRLTVGHALPDRLDCGDSVAVGGVCLTAVSVQPGSFVCEVMRETLRRSALGRLAGGAAVNLELPLRPSDRLGGHVVQGHVDGVGTVAEAREDGFARVLAVTAEPEVLRYVAAQGSIAVDGVSLTVSAVAGDRFEVSLVPETLRRTTLGAAGPGTPVNLEVDVLAKYVERLLAAGAAR